MAYFYWTHNFNRNCHILHKIAIVRILIYVGWRAECYNFFLSFLHVFGRCRETMTGDNSWVWYPPPFHPHLTAPNVDLKLVFRHGIMDRPWLQRKRTDTLTTYSNCFFVFVIFKLFFLGLFFFFFFLFLYKPTPPPKTKHFAPVGPVGWEEDWKKVLADSFNHLHHHPEKGGKKRHYKACCLVTISCLIQNRMCFLQVYL